MQAGLVAPHNYVHRPTTVDQTEVENMPLAIEATMESPRGLGPLVATGSVGGVSEGSGPAGLISAGGA